MRRLSRELQNKFPDQNLQRSPESDGRKLEMMMALSFDRLNALENGIKKNTVEMTLSNEPSRIEVNYFLPERDLNVKFFEPVKPKLSESRAKARVKARIVRLRENYVVQLQLIREINDALATRPVTPKSSAKADKLVQRFSRTFRLQSNID